MTPRRCALNPGQSAGITLLGKKTAHLDGRIIEHQGATIELMLPSDVPAGAAIQVICGESIFLGEVRFCRPEGAGFVAGLDLEHALYDTVQLARLADRILGES